MVELYGMNIDPNIRGNTGQVGARGEKIPSYKLMIDFGPNGSKSPGNGRVLITNCAKCLVPRVVWTPIFGLYPIYRGNG